jgi:hypothetical protein
MYRSIADGELVTPWTLPDYFKSLNTVLRLPAKVRRKAVEAAQQTAGGVAVLAALERIRIPKGLVLAGAAVAVIMLVIRPLVLSATNEGASKLPQAFGVWEATAGKYKGRTFEVSEHELAFQTSAKGSLTRHKIVGVAAKSRPDSTRFTVTYESEGQTAEFAFWYVTSPSPAIRFVNQHDVTWTKVKTK